MRDLLFFLFAILVAVLIWVFPVRAEETKTAELGWGPSAVGTFGAFYINGDYKLMQSGLGVGTAYSFGTKNISSVGIYFGPQASQVDGITGTTLFTMIYADLYKTTAGRFGIGLGTMAWKSGDGFTGFGRAKNTFMALGYKF